MPTKKATTKRTAKQSYTVRLQVERTRTVSTSLLRKHYCAQFPSGYKTPPPPTPALLHQMGITAYRFTRLLQGSPPLGDELLAYCKHFKANPETIVQLIPTRESKNHD